MSETVSPSNTRRNIYNYMFKQSAHRTQDVGLISITKCLKQSAHRTQDVISITTCLKQSTHRTQDQMLDYCCVSIADGDQH